MVNQKNAKNTEIEDNSFYIKMLSIFLPLAAILKIYFLL